MAGVVSTLVCSLKQRAMSPVRRLGRFHCRPCRRTSARAFTIPEDINRVAQFYDVTPDGSRFVMVRKSKKLDPVISKIVEILRQ